MSLREKLQEKERARRFAQKDAKLSLQEWLTSIKGLYRLVWEELAELRRDKLIEFGSQTVDRSEELTGKYKTSELTLRAGGRTIVFSPVARFVVGSYGRVDLYALGRLNVRYYVLLDKTAGGADRWVITEADTPRKHPLSALPELSRATLEDAIEKLLSA